MSVKRKELNVIGQQPVERKPQKRGVEMGPFTFEEIKKIRERPTASYLDLVRMLATYDESTKEIEKVRVLSSTHYQHHVDAMKMYQDLKKEVVDITGTLKKLLTSLEEAVIDES